MRSTLYTIAVAKQAVKQLQLRVAQAAAGGGRYADGAVVFHQQHALRMLKQFGHVAIVLPQTH